MVQCHARGARTSRLVLVSPLLHGWAGQARTEPLAGGLIEQRMNTFYSYLHTAAARSALVHCLSIPFVPSLWPRFIFCAFVAFVCACFVCYILYLHRLLTLAHSTNI
jgi:hypothetical protein